MKNQGFTLIELLAVIVILAIIALIATPTILGVIEKAKKGSFKNSVYGLIDSANLYVTEHLESSSLTFTCDGKSCSSKDGGKLSFKGSVPKSGNIIVDSKQKVSVEIITDGTYCATGTLENLAVEKGCNNLDTTAPTIDENGVVLTSTTNSITVKIAENFAKDPESGIKEYKVTVNGETKILKEVGSLTFTGLTKETEYSVEINVFNNKNLNNKLIKKIVTKNFDNPSITLTNTPTAAVNGYLKSQVAKITYNGTNISSPKYFVKTTREGTISLAVTKSCGTGTTPNACTNVTSTKTLTANTWYQVSGNVNVTYSDASDTTGTVYAITYDGTNYSGASTATISKIDTTSPTFTVNSSTGGVGSSGTISIENVNEQESGIEGYYIGQVKPNSIGDNVTFGKSTSFTINASGTWYVAVKDNAGNMSEVQSVVYYSLTLNSDGATNYSTNSAFIKVGTSVNLPAGLVKSGYKADTWSGGITTLQMNENKNLSPDWEILPQNWTLSIPITYKINVSGSVRTTTENIIVTCKNDNISLTGGNNPGGKAAYSWTARGYYYTSNSYFSIGQPTISYNGQNPKDFNIGIRINSQIYDYSNWDGYGGGFATDKGNATNQDISIYYRNGVITYSPTTEIHTSNYGSSTSNDGHTLIDEFHLNSMTLILKEFL